MMEDYNQRLGEPTAKEFPVFATEQGAASKALELLREFNVRPDQTGQKGAKICKIPCSFPCIQGIRASRLLNQIIGEKGGTRQIAKRFADPRRVSNRAWRRAISFETRRCGMLLKNEEKAVEFVATPLRKPDRFAQIHRT
jgi:hypothetical protein